MTIMVDHFRAELEGVGWTIEEKLFEGGWKIVGVRQGQSFIYVGRERYSLWESAAAKHCRVDPAGQG